ncbi:MAG: LysR family transcriptional regulator [Proteobacteria bacterium]|nr:MAG: LysR family transcriptional regulator [Pseudomonadota bacterium]
MQNDNLSGLLALKAVADKRNFRAAAAALGLSPSAISQSVKQLEQRLGVTLLSRTTRSTGLTEAGEQFLAEAGPALDQILAAMQSVGSLGRKPSGLLRINLPRAIYRTHFPDLIQSFTRRYTDVSVELFFEDAQADLSKGGFDAGVRGSEILDQDMIAVRLTGPVRYVVVGAPKYFAKMGRPKHPKDLHAHNCIRPRFGGGGIYDRWEFEQKGKEFQVHVKGNLIMNDSNFVVEAASRGHGLIYTLEESIKDHLKSGKLEVVLNSFAAQSTGFYLYYPKRSQMLPKLRAFVDHIHNQLHDAQ